MMKPALRGVPALVLATLLIFAQPCLGQDGPLLPGLEPSDPAPAPLPIEDAEVVPSPVEAPLPVAESSLPIDNTITPLDENGQPMSGPESDGAVTKGRLRLPAPPPLRSRVPAPLNSPGGPSLSLDGETPAGKSAEERLEGESQKRNLWQRSTDALRDIGQPKSKKESATEQDAARHWQSIRQRELEQMQRQQRELQQRQLQQREMQQREMQRWQFEQRQLQQRKAVPSQGAGDPRTRMQGAQPQQRAFSTPATPGVEARAVPPVTTPQTSRRQPQRFNSPQPNSPPGQQAVPPSARGRQSAQPREAKNEPRSPWERS